MRADRAAAAVADGGVRREARALRPHRPASRRFYENMLKPKLKVLVFYRLKVCESTFWRIICAKERS